MYIQALHRLVYLNILLVLPISNNSVNRDIIVAVTCSVPVWRPGLNQFSFTPHCLLLLSRWPYQWTESWPPQVTHRKTTPCWALMISSMWVGAPVLLTYLDLLSATTSWAASRRYTIDALFPAWLIEVAGLVILLLVQQLMVISIFVCISLVNIRINHHVNILVGELKSAFT